MTVTMVTSVSIATEVLHNQQVKEKVYKKGDLAEEREQVLQIRSVQRTHFREDRRESTGFLTSIVDTRYSVDFQVQVSRVDAWNQNLCTTLYNSLALI